MKVSQGLTSILSYIGVFALEKVYYRSNCPVVSLETDRKSTRLNSSHRQISYALFFFNDTATSEIYTLSLHDALPISQAFCLISGFSPWRRFIIGPTALSSPLKPKAFITEMSTSLFDTAVESFFWGGTVATSELFSIFSRGSRAFWLSVLSKDIAAELRMAGSDE